MNNVLDEVKMTGALKTFFLRFFSRFTNGFSTSHTRCLTHHSKKAEILMLLAGVHSKITNENSSKSWIFSCYAEIVEEMENIASNFRHPNICSHSSNTAKINKKTEQKFLAHTISTMSVGARPNSSINWIEVCFLRYLSRRDKFTNRFIALQMIYLPKISGIVRR